jgi:APA family basic amino acid/polyamine antiporter
VILYLAVTFVCIRVLGTTGLALTSAPASDVMRSVLGEWGARAIATGIAISTLGFLSQGMLTAPRVYFAMAQDGLFFRSVGRLHPNTLVPVVAIALQGVLAIVIAWVGVYDQILNYVVSVDFIFFGLTAACIFVFRRRHRKEEGEEKGITVPGHPFTTLLFIAVCWLVVLNTIFKYPQNTLIGIAILLAGIPAYLAWRWRNVT